MVENSPYMGPTVKVDNNVNHRATTIFEVNQKVNHRVNNTSKS